MLAEGGAELPDHRAGGGSASARRLALGDLDLDHLQQLLPTAAAELEGHRGGPELLLRSALIGQGDSLTRYAARPGHVVIAGGFSGTTLGFAAVRLEALGGAGGAPVAVVDALYVEPGARRAGVADAIVQEVLAYAAERGCGAAELIVLPGDRAGKSLLEGWGFTARALVMRHALPPLPAAAEQATQEGPARRIVPCAGAVVVAAGRLLLVRRGRDPEAGKWSLPGGRIEPGEDARAAAERETYEETGCRVVARRLRGTALVPAGEVLFSIEDFDADLAGGEEEGLVPVPGSDAEAATFVDRGGLDELELVSGLRDWLAAHSVLEELRSTPDGDSDGDGSAGAGGGAGGEVDELKIPGADDIVMVAMTLEGSEITYRDGTTVLYPLYENEAARKGKHRPPAGMASEVYDELAETYPPEALE